MQLQLYDEKHCVYLARIGRHSEKKTDRNVTTHAQHRIYARI